ncbi:MAG: hypothetical protein AB7J13_05755 [Pyrinomonadaceae bacterium]
MLQNAIVSFLIVIISGIFAFVLGQTAAKPVVVVGDVVTVDGTKFTVKAPAGPVEVTMADATKFNKVSPDNPKLSAATAGSMSEIGVGDRLTISALPNAETKGLVARTVYYMMKADIDAKNAKDAAEWRTRGITGKVISANTQTNQIVVETRTLTGAVNVTVTPKEGAQFKRYAPDSVRFEEALDSSLAEIKPGDMFRAKGDKSSDGTSLSAEAVVTGAFQTIAGTVKSIDLEKNQVLVTDLQTKKDVTVAIVPASVVKRFPPEQAEQMARIQMMQAMAAGGARPVGGGRPGGGTPPAAGGNSPGGGGQRQGRAPGGGFGGARPGGGAVDDMLDRFPNITAADLKVGDMIAFSSSKNGTSTSFKAIKLLAGVEPFLRAAQAGGGGRRGGGGGVEAGFSIPGLDGADFP